VCSRGCRSLTLDAHADTCVFGKAALIFQDFDTVAISSYDLEGETKLLRTVSAVVGYTTPATERVVMLIVQKSFFFHIFLTAC
jgi:hypothetical protein